MKKIILLFGLLLLIGVGCKGGSGQVAVRVDAPTNVNVGEAFSITVTIQNPGEEDHLLDSIDIGTSYLDGVAVETSEPPYSDTFHIPVDNTISHTFLADIPAGETLEVTFQAVAYASGLFVGDFDVCIDTGYSCQFLTISTNIVGDEAFDLSLDLDDYELVIDAPEQVGVNDLVELHAFVTNNKDQDAVLDSIDIGAEYLAGVNLTSATPPFTDVFLIEADSTRSHTFDQTIEPGQTVEVVFYGSASAVGNYVGAFDVCMDVGYNCWFETVQTAVE